MQTAKEKCWCDSGELADVCCWPLLHGEKQASTAEALMRSRYSAYVNCNEKYLLATWDAATRPAQLHLDERQRWLGLKIRHVEAGSKGDEQGLVEFVARFKIDGRGHRLHERSRFRRTQLGWVYVDGELLNKSMPS
ncbi:MAG: YchJ family metal-binding protein [Pseudomonadales bacterium]|jgi:SEC-C motif-containing protein|nr:YchJ family metal-binding protein [Pseudomonadales bacterium]